MTLLGGDIPLVLPASALLGATLLVLGDVASRTLIAPDDRLIGIVTGMVGGLFFALILRRRPK